MNYDIYRFGRIDSTNNYVLSLGDRGFPEGTVAVADEQSAGRGRFGRKWEGESSSSLLFSVLLRPDFLSRDELFILTFSAAVAVSEAIADVTGIETELKWPNDVLIRNKKVCGILLESDFVGDRLNHVVLGIGLNVNQTRFTGEIEGRATSLCMAAGRTFDREEVLSAVLFRLNRIYESLRMRDFYRVMKLWRARSNMFGKAITLRLAGKEIEGVLEDVTDDGAAVIRTRSGEEKFTAGEITITGFRAQDTGGTN